MGKTIYMVSLLIFNYSLGAKIVISANNLESKDYLRPDLISTR